MDTLGWALCNSCTLESSMLANEERLSSDFKSNSMKAQPPKKSEQHKVQFWNGWANKNQN